MQDHHLQKKILHTLVLNDDLKFSELRPKGVDSNVVTYHLKQLIADKLVIKTEDGKYRLTSLGRVAGINVSLSKRQLLEQAHSVILMCLRTEKEGWLLRRRLAQPMYRKVGFVHAEPVVEENAEETAKNTFKSRTGLEADFKVAGTGYVKLLKDGALESFVHFILMTADSYSGKLEPIKRNGENFWAINPDFTAEDMIPSMQAMVDALEKSDGIFFVDLTYDI